jgi:hypothetical protein
LLALAVVGRIILAKKPSWSPEFDLGRLCLLACFVSFSFGGGPRLGRCELLEDFLGGSLEDVPWTVLVRRAVFVDPVTFTAGGLDPATFDSELAVGAVKCEGSFTGLVGDFGRGLLKEEAWVVVEGLLGLTATDELDDVIGGLVDPGGLTDLLAFAAIPGALDAEMRAEV